MKCDLPEQEKMIAAYLMNELSDEEVKKFQEHLFNCDICFNDVTLKRKAIRLIKKEGNVILQESSPGWIRVPLELFTTLKYTFFPNVKTGLVYAFIAVTIFTAIFVYDSDENKDILKTITYDKKVPFQYEPGAVLRGQQGKNPEATNNFRHQFALAMLDYKDREYQSAIDKLENLQQQAEALEADENSKNETSLFADYYFFLGVSHFALTRNPNTSLDTKIERKHLQAAINSLSKSEKLARTMDAYSEDKYRYFLGIAHGFSGHPQLAIEELKKIEPQSQFYEVSSQLINRWVH